MREEISRHAGCKKTEETVFAAPPTNSHFFRNPVLIDVRLMMRTEKTLVDIVGHILGTNVCNGFGKTICRA